MKALVAKNTIYQVLSRLTTATSFFLVTIIITRFSGSELYGKLAVVLTYSYIFYVLSEFGFNSFLVKEYSKDEAYAHETFTKVLVFKIIYGSLMVALAIAVSVFMPYTNEIKRAILLASPVIILQSIYTSSTVILQSYLKYIYQFLSVIIGSVVSVGLSYYFAITSSQSLNNQIVAYLVGYFILTVLSIYFVKAYVYVSKIGIDKKLIKTILLETSPFGFSLLVNFLMINADRLIMSIYSPYHSIAIYSVAYRIFELILIIPAFFMNSMYPILSNLQVENYNVYRNKAYKSMKYLLALSIIVVVSVWGLSNILIPVLFGNELKESYVALNILSVGIPLFFITSPLSWIMVLEKKQLKLLYINIVALVLNIVACVIYIPVYDFVAAAWITTISELLILILLLFNLKDFLWNKLAVK